MKYLPFCLLMLFAVFAFCFILTGCGDLKVETSTDERMKDSIAEVKAALPEHQRADFEEAVMTLAFADVDNLGDLAALGETGGLEHGIKERIGGRTGPQIIAEAERVRAERERREEQREAERDAARKKAEEARLELQRQQAIAEIRELAAKLDAAGPELLSRFVVERSRFGDSDSMFSRSKSIVLTVRNDGERAVSRADFQGVLLSPGREMPWIEAEFSYQIPGGLESGESATWSLRPNMFGGWNTAPTDRSDMLFITRPIELEGADGNSLAADRFDSGDRKRLLALLESTEYDGRDDVIARLKLRDQEAAEWQKSATAASAQSEFDELSTLEAEARANTSEMSKFVVEKSRFYFSDGAFLKNPIIELTVRNGTDQTITRFHARGVLASAGRQAPWIDDTFNYAIPGGLKPGEVKDLKLAPNMFGDWGKAPKDQDDMVLTVTTTRLDGPEGKQLFEIVLTEKDALRLEALKVIVTELGGK